MRIVRAMPGDIAPGDVRTMPGHAAPGPLVGGVLTRELVAGALRLHKGHRLTDADLALIAAQPDLEPFTVLLPDPGEVHEDEAAIRLAAAIAGQGSGLVARAPVASRVDLVAAEPGLVEVRTGALERLNRIDLLGVFTVLSGQPVAADELVASVKVAPHLLDASVLAQGEDLARRGAPLVRVRPFRPVRLASIVKGVTAAPARARFEAAVAVKAAGLGATPAPVAWVRDEPTAIAAALTAAVAGPGGAQIVLAAGGASMDPSDAFFRALDRVGGRMVRRGAPAHPGSMLWLARLGSASVIGLPSCGAFSMATAADLLLAMLVAGYPATPGTVARLGHGGVLAPSQRFRFPAYARTLDPSDVPDTSDG